MPGDGEFPAEWS